jgi:hypothetical protein
VLLDTRADLADALEQALGGEAYQGFSFRRKGQPLLLDNGAVNMEIAFGVTGPAVLPCLPLRFHIAQKLHGTTLPPRPGKQNERFRDLVDLLLLEAVVAHDYVALREASELVFRSRKTHPWPPDLDAMPPHWAEPFARGGTRVARERRRDGAREGPELRRSHPQRVVVNRTGRSATHGWWASAG